MGAWEDSVDANRLLRLPSETVGWAKAADGRSR